MNKNQVIGCVIAALLILGSGIAIALSYLGNNDGIKEGKEYGLAYTYLSDIKLPDGKVVAGRTFDFSDRNLPRLSVVVPLADRRGRLVYEDQTMKEGSVKKVRVKVPTQDVEGVVYPGYEFVTWRFNFNLKAKQEFIPTVTPKK